ncbi:MAG: MCE family protein [Crocinitomicaceae bacterium]|nr:MCE family protein [Crocinitomicaceae bacterium]
MRVSKEFKVGLLVILGLLLLFVGVNFLKGGGIFGKDREFYAEFSNSSGLQPSNEVQLNGVRVGQVTSVDLKEDDPSKVIVHFTIEKDELLVPTDAEVWLISSDFLGTKALDLRIPTEEKPRADIAYYNDGDQIDPNHVHTALSLEAQIEEEILPLKKKTEELIGSVEQIIVSVNAFWDTSAAYTIDESLYEVRDAVARFGDLAVTLSVLVEDNTTNIHNVLTNLNDVAENLANQKDSINAIITNLTCVSRSMCDADLDTILAETKVGLQNLNKTLDEVNNGDGTIGKLLRSDSLHEEIVETNIVIQNLLRDFDENPNKFVHFSLFGRKVKGYQTTEEREQLLNEILDSIQRGNNIHYEPK